MQTERHTVSVEAPPSAPAWVDPLRLEQVLTNLVGNAIRYSPQGGPIGLTLAVDPGATVHHALAVDARSGHVFVANNYGTPASPSVLSRLVAWSRPWLPAWGQQYPTPGSAQRIAHGRRCGAPRCGTRVAIVCPS